MDIWLRQYVTILLYACFKGSWSYLPEKYGELTATHEFYFFGETIEFTCRVIDPYLQKNASTRDIYIRRANSPQHLGDITPRDNTSITVHVDVTSSNDSDMYYCTIATPSDTIGLGNWFIEADYPLDAVTNLSCVTKQFLTITCSYNLPQDYLHPLYIIGHVFYHLPDYEDPEEECYQGIERVFSLEPGHNLYTNYTFRVLLVHTERNETAWSEPFFFNPQSAVVPGSVKSLRVAKLTSRRIFLVWEPPDTSHRYICKITNTATWGKREESENKLTRVFGLGWKHQTVLQNLSPGTWYKVSVSCRACSFTGSPFGHWGEICSINSRTKPAVPDTAPQIAPAVSRPTNQEVVLHWKPVGEKQQNAALRHYEIEVRYGGQTERNRVGIDRHYLNLLLGLLQQEIHTTVALVNNVGYSPKSAFTITPTDQEPESVPDFWVIDDSESMVTFHWSQSPGPTSRCHVFWCQGSASLSSCWNKISWKSIPCDLRNVTVDIGQVDGFYGFSIELASPTVTRVASRINWTNCIYSKHQAPRAPTGLALSKPQPLGAIKLEWRRPDCVENPTYISHYVVSFCQWQKALAACADELRQNIVKRDANSHVIADLEPELYRVRVKVISHDNNGPESVALFCRVKAAHDPIMIPTVLSTLSVVVFLFFFIIAYKRCKHCLCRREHITIPRVHVEAPTCTRSQVTRQRKGRVKIINKLLWRDVQKHSNSTTKEIFFEKVTGLSRSASEISCYDEDNNRITVETEHYCHGPENRYGNDDTTSIIIEASENFRLKSNLDYQSQADHNLEMENFITQTSLEQDDCSCSSNCLASMTVNKEEKEECAQTTLKSVSGGYVVIGKPDCN